MKAVLYSALYGNYHDTFPYLKTVDCDAFAFTDHVECATESWQTVVVPYPVQGVHPRMAAKWFKLHPHDLFPEYDVSIWIDAGWRTCDSTLAKDMTPYLGDNSLCFFPHRRNDNLLKELYETMSLQKYKQLPCPSQVVSYYADGYQDENGVLECTSLLRRHNEKDAIKFNEAWWHENQQWTFCDQLSAPYVLWKENIKFSRFPCNLGTQQWFTLETWRGDT